MIHGGRLAALLATLLLATSLAGCSGSESTNADTDGDGLTDATERAPREITVITGAGSTKQSFTSDPVKFDTDGDTLNDADEDDQRTNPSSPDTDGDRLLDGFNVTLPAGDPRVAEWRAAGIIESPPLTFLGELGQCRHVGGLKGAQFSSDRPFSDALGDGEEFAGWDITVRGMTRHVQPDPCFADADGDFARDDQELDLGTDPNVRDTDGDGAVDGADLDPLWDVRVAFTNVGVTYANGSTEVFAAFNSTVVEPGERGSFDLEVPEEVIAGNVTREAFQHKALLYVLDAQTRRPLALFGEEVEVLLVFGIQAATLTVNGEPAEGELTTTGPDGSLRLSWAIVRR